MANSQGDRQEEQRGQGQRPHARLNDAADKETPGPARQVINHQYGH